MECLLVKSTEFSSFLGTVAQLAKKNPQHLVKCTLNSVVKVTVFTWLALGVSAWSGSPLWELSSGF